MQKAINNSRLPLSNNLINNNSILPNSINASRIQLDHYYQKHQPHTLAGKLAAKTEQQQNNYIQTNNQQSTLLKKHVYTNDLNSFNLFHLSERDKSDSNPQVITLEQVKNEQKMLNYYSKALIITIIVGILMFAINVSIFVILINRKMKQDSRQKQVENDERQQQKQTQQSDHFKMINNEELVQYDDYLEVCIW